MQKKTLTISLMFVCLFSCFAEASVPAGCVCADSGFFDVTNQKGQTARLALIAAVENSAIFRDSNNKLFRIQLEDLSPKSRERISRLSAYESHSSELLFGRHDGFDSWTGANGVVKEMALCGINSRKAVFLTLDRELLLVPIKLLDESSNKKLSNFSPSEYKVSNLKQFFATTMAQDEEEISAFVNNVEKLRSRMEIILSANSIESLRGYSVSEITSGLKPNGLNLKVSKKTDVDEATLKAGIIELIRLAGEAEGIDTALRSGISVSFVNPSKPPIIGPPIIGPPIIDPPIIDPPIIDPPIIDPPIIDPPIIDPPIIDPPMTLDFGPLNLVCCPQLCCPQLCCLNQLPPLAVETAAMPFIGDTLIKHSNVEPASFVSTSSSVVPTPTQLTSNFAISSAPFSCCDTDSINHRSGCLRRVFGRIRRIISPCIP